MSTASEERGCAPLPFTLIAIVEAAVLSSSLSVDAFAAGFAYGSRKIKLPAISVHIVNLICAGITGLALLAGGIVREYIPPVLTVAISFAILFIIGAAKLIDSITKSVIRKYSNISREFRFSLFNFRFILHLYANPEDADADASSSISPAEAAALALSLSLDGIGVGFGAALTEVNGIALVLWSLLTNVLFLLAGHRIGARAAQKLSFNLSWLGGAALMALALAKLF